MSELKTIVLDGVKYVEVREEAIKSGSEPKFKVGDLAKVLQGDTAIKTNEILRLTEITNEPYNHYGSSINTGNLSLFADYQLEPYTPQAGDVLTVDGVEYRLVDRKAEVGEKVLVIKNFAYGNYGEIHDVTKSRPHCGDISTNKAPLMNDSRYLVLQPTATETKPQSINVTITITNEGSVEEIAKRLMSELKKAVR